MKLRLLPFILLAVLGATAAHADRYRHTEPFRFTSAFNPDARVSVSNVNGQVTVTTWDRPEILIEGEKRAKSADDLERIELIYQLDADRADVEVKLPKKRGWFFGSTIDGNVSIHVTVPATVDLRNIRTVNGSIEIEGVAGAAHASSVNGRIRAHHLGGDADFHSVNGPIDADFDHVPSAARLSFDTVNGRIRVNLPADTGAEVSASVVNGSINTDLPIAVKGKFIKKHLNGTIGDGGARIDASAVNGSIHFTTNDS